MYSFSTLGYSVINLIFSIDHLVISMYKVITYVVEKGISYDQYILLAEFS